MLVVRGILALLTIGLGAVLLARMLALAPGSGFAILPGVVLGGALVALGLHRIALILRVLRARGAA